MIGSSNFFWIVQLNKNHKAKERLTPSPGHHHCMHCNLISQQLTWVFPFKDTGTGIVINCWPPVKTNKKCNWNKKSVCIYGKFILDSFHKRHASKLSQSFRNKWLISGHFINIFFVKSNATHEVMKQFTLGLYLSLAVFRTIIVSLTQHWFLTQYE